MRHRFAIARVDALERPSPFLLAGLTASFTALSVGTPYAVHLLGGPALGRALLPMHFFVLASGLLLGWQSGLAAGLLSPLLSFGLSGMPPLAMLFPLTLEIAAYGLTAGLVRGLLRRSLWLPLLLAVIAGRVVAGAAVYALGISNPFAYMGTALVAGLPGIAIQMTVIPAVVKLFLRRT